MKTDYEKPLCTAIIKVHNCLGDFVNYRPLLCNGNQTNSISKDWESKFELINCNLKNQYFMFRSYSRTN